MGQRARADAVDHAEDRRVRADASASVRMAMVANRALRRLRAA
jgi:hypothetical protein